MRRRAGLAWLTAALLAATATASEPALDTCDAEVARAPRDALSYYCYLRAVRAGASPEDAVRRLDATLAVDPVRHRARMILGMIEDLRDRPRAEGLLREAAASMEPEGDWHGVYYASLTLAFRLGELGRLDEAEIETARSLRAAQATGDRYLVAGARAQQGDLARRAGDYGRSLRLFRWAEREVFPDGPRWLQGNVLSGLAWLHWYFGEHRQAMGTYEREAEIRRSDGDLYGEATLRHNVAMLACLLAERRRLDEAACDAAIGEALAASRGAHDLETEAQVLLLRGMRLPHREKVADLETALAMAEQSSDLGLRWRAMALLGLGSGRFDPIDRSVAEARDAGDSYHLAFGLLRRAELAERNLGRDEIISAWLECLDAVEKIRIAQTDPSTRSLATVPWGSAYRRLATFLLGGLTRSPDHDGDLDLAFETTERLRARALLELLEEHDSREDPPRAAAIPGTVPGVSEVREHLAADQAMLYFLMGPLTGSREDPSRSDSWLLVLTRDDVRVTRLPDAATLEDQTTILEGLIGKRDGSDESAAVALYRSLIATALDGLPEGVQKLVVAPDGPLHRLPFGALRPRQGSDPLASRFEISVVPSAAVWIRLKGLGTSFERGVLALADPEVPARAAEEVFRTALPWVEGDRIGGLPGARAEVARLAGAVGGKSRVLTGSLASERAVKEVDPSGFSVLHLAAHAVVDHDRPSRSAVLLAPGSEDEDGRLQASEIVDLDLDGKVVLLSACSGASGRLIEGEGVINLARAFMEAGARTVVASLWRVRDEDVAALMESFAHGIERGESVAAALSSAKRSRHAAGAASAAWAGMVLIGDGEWAPVPGGAVTWFPSRGLLWGTAIATLIVVVVFVVRRLNAS